MHKMLHSYYRIRGKLLPGLPWGEELRTADHKKATQASVFL